MPNTSILYNIFFCFSPLIFAVKQACKIVKSTVEINLNWIWPSETSVQFFNWIALDQWIWRPRTAHVGRLSRHQTHSLLLSWRMLEERHIQHVTRDTSSFPYTVKNVLNLFDITSNNQIHAIHWSSIILVYTYLNLNTFEAGEVNALL